jgi:uncharacterized membrane protein YtjA (UPF0391 family)
MFRCALIFFFIAVVAGFLGFISLSGPAGHFAKIAFYSSLGLIILLALIHGVRGDQPE